MLRHKYVETERIRELLMEVEALKIVFDTLSPLPHIERNIRRESLLKSSVYSARVEGNPLTVDVVRDLPRNSESENDKKREIFNLLSAYNQIYQRRFSKTVSVKLIRKLHSIALKGISSGAGKFRTEPWAIYNQAGVAIYLAPPHFKVPDLMSDLVELCEKLNYKVPVNAAIMQFLFEKIHPFPDGNGRVGRLISANILMSGGYGFKGLVSLEEYVDKDRLRYYQALEPTANSTKFVEFYLESLVAQAKSVLPKLQSTQGELPEDELFPRRREIVEIIREHPYCSFNFISRRFASVNPKTLHYDLKKLQDSGFVVKIGKTRGVTYKAR